MKYPPVLPGSPSPRATTNRRSLTPELEFHVAATAAKDALIIWTGNGVKRGLHLTHPALRAQIITIVFFGPIVTATLMGPAHSLKPGLELLDSTLCLT